VLDTHPRQNRTCPYKKTPIFPEKDHKACAYEVKKNEEEEKQENGPSLPQTQTHIHTHTHKTKKAKASMYF
jgi:hypothetical protein